MLRGLHKECDRGNWDGARAILQRAGSANSASEKGGWGEWTPLHLVCKRDPPLDVVQDLIGLAPESVTETDVYNRLPIHYLAENGVTDEDILVSLYQVDVDGTSATTVDSDGYTPLHLSILRCSAPEGGSEDGDSRSSSNDENGTGQELPSLTELEILSPGASIADASGSLPLHYACHLLINSWPAEAFERMIQSHPESIVACDVNGRTPLHIALMNLTTQCLDDKLHLLLSEDVAKTKDSDGCLPLHYACKNHSALSIQAMQEILEMNPEAAIVKSGNGDGENHEGNYPLGFLEESRSTITDEDEMLVFDAKSDLIFTCNPVKCDNSQQEDRLARFETRIIEEVFNNSFLATNELILSEPLQRVWSWMCAAIDSDDTCAASVNRIILHLLSPGTLPPDIACDLLEDGCPSLPLHYACGILIDICAVDVFDILVQRDPTSIVSLDSKKRTPLHIALMTVQPESQDFLDEKLHLLLNDKVAQIKDEDGFLPIHYACYNYEALSFEAFHQLLDCYPEGAAVKIAKGVDDEEEGECPLDIMDEMQSTITDPEDFAIFNDKSDLVFAYHPRLGLNANDNDRLKRFETRIINEVLLSISDDSKNEDGQRLVLSEPLKSVWAWMCRELRANEDYGNIVDRIIVTLLSSGSLSSEVACDLVAGVCPSLPLHYACSLFMHTSAIDLVDMLVEKFPSSIEQKDTRGRCPLHIALLKATADSPASLNGKLKLLLTPEVARVKDNNGYLPLHYACSSNFVVSLEIHLQLLEYYPEGAGIQAKSEDGDNNVEHFPLDLLELGRSHIEDQEELSTFNHKSDILFAYDPDSVAHHMEQQRLRRFEKMLVENILVSIKQVESKGRSSESFFVGPLRKVWDWICEHSVKDSVLAASVKRMFQNILLSSGPLPLSVSKDLLDKSPLPLHFACEMLLEAQTIDLVANLAKSHPDALAAQDSTGRTPLHIVLMQASSKTEPVLDAAMDVLLNQEAAQVQDANGYLPIHHACKNHSLISMDCLNRLLEIVPQSAKKKTGDKGYFPLDILEQGRSEVSLNQNDISAFNHKSDMVFAYNPNLEKYGKEEDRLTRFEVRIAVDLRVNTQEANDPLNMRDKSLQRVWTWICSLATSHELYAGFVNRIIRRVSSSGSVPLHFVCTTFFNICSVSSFESFVSNGRSSLTAQDKQGSTPLHIALKTATSETPHFLPSPAEKIMMLLTPNVARIKDDDGYLPLHLACKNVSAVSVDIFQQLLELFPEGAATRTIDDTALYPLELMEQRRPKELQQKDIVAFNTKSDLVFAYNPGLNLFCTDERLTRFENKIVDELVNASKRDFCTERAKVLSEPLKRVWIWMCTTSDDSGVHASRVERIIRRLSTTESGKDKNSSNYELMRILGSFEAEGTPLYRCASLKCIEHLFRWFRFADRFEFYPGDFRESENSLLVSAKEFSLAQEKENTEWNDITKKSFTERNVVIKFMADRKAFVREKILSSRLVEYNNDGDIHPTVVPAVRVYDMDRIGKSNCSADDVRFCRDIQNEEQTIPFDLSRFRYAIVKLATGANIDEIVGTDIMDMSKVQKYSCQIGEALRHLHNKGVVHGNMMTSNIVRFKETFAFADLGAACISNTKSIEFYGGIGHGTTIYTGTMPPEMVAKLNARQVRAYERYWKPVRDDATIASLFLPNDVNDVQRKVDEFLGCEQDQSQDNQNQALLSDDPSFSTLWSRITTNSKLWKKMCPQKFGDSFYVLKCFRQDGNSFSPVESRVLPYQLLESSPMLDIWSFGILVFKLCSAEDIFPLKESNDLAGKESFAHLFSWNSDSTSASINDNEIRDPLARDLLRKLLTTIDKRPSSMGDVLKHPFFYNASSMERKRASAKVLLQEAEVVRQKHQAEESKRKGKDQDAWVKDRTEHISLLSTDSQLKFEHSTWNQWETLSQYNGAYFPACILILPYKLARNKDNSLIVPEHSNGQASRFGALLAELMNSVAFTAEIIQGVKSDDRTHSHKLDRYNDLNQNEMGYAETGIVDICRGIVTRVDNAEKILADILCEATVQDPKSCAEMIVSTMLRRIIDVEVCRKIVQNAKYAEDALKSMASTTGQDPLPVAKQIVNDNFEVLLGSKFCKGSARRKMDVEMTLFSVLKTFASDPLLGAMAVVKKTADGLIDLYTSSKTMYLYLVDEYSGLPAEGDIYPREIDATPDTVRAVIQCLRISVKASCAVDMVTGLAKLVGLQSENIPQTWLLSLPKYRAGEFDPISSMTEFDLLREVITGRSDGAPKRISRSEALLNLESYLVAVDPDRSYAGLRRVTGLGNSVLWSTRSSVAKMQQQAYADLEEFAKKKRQEAVGSYAKLHNEDGPKQGLNYWQGVSAASVTVPNVIHLSETEKAQEHNFDKQEKRTKEVKHSSNWEDELQSFPGLPGDSLSFSSGSSPTDSSSLATNRPPLLSLPGVATVPQDSPRGIPRSPRRAPRVVDDRDVAKRTAKSFGKGMNQQPNNSPRAHSRKTPKISGSSARQRSGSELSEYEDNNIDDQENSFRPGGGGGGGSTSTGNLMNNPPRSPLRARKMHPAASVGGGGGSWDGQSSTKSPSSHNSSLRQKLQHYTNTTQGQEKPKKQPSVYTFNLSPREQFANRAFRYSF